MLKKSHITKIQIHSEEWHQARLGKLTASEIYNLMGEKEWTEGALSFLYRKIGEELSGLPCRDEVDTTATRHGILYETEAIRLFQEHKQPIYTVTQCLISDPESRFSCTPDALFVTGGTNDEYSVETVECKCPLSFDGYIRLFLCKTPEDILKAEKKYFYQVIDQMLICDALVGYLVIYHPHFKAGKMNVVEFRKMNLLPFFKTLKERKEKAVAKFNEVREMLLSK